MTNELELKQEDKLSNLGQQMATFPEIQVSGQLIIENYDEQLEKLDLVLKGINDLPCDKIKNDDEYWNINNILKGLQTFQSQLKLGLTQLDDDRITKIRNATNEVVKILGKKCGETAEGIKFLLKEYKDKTIKRIIDCGFTNIINQTDFKTTYEEFESYCLEQFKGAKGLKFDKLQDDAIRISNNFNNEMELQQFKLDKNIIELKKFCDEIQYIPDMDNLKILAKELVFNRVKIEEIELQLKEKKEQQEKALQQRIEFEREQERLKIEKEQQEKNKIIEPVLEKNIESKIEEVIVDKTYTFSITITTSLEKKELLKKFLIENNIKYN